MQLDQYQTFLAGFRGGALLVIAPSGSGKTAGITARAASLIKAGLPAGKLLMTTFSRKAADEISERVLEEASSLPKILTIHKLGITILKEHPELCDRKRGVNIIDKPMRLYRLACNQSGLDDDQAIKDTFKFYNNIRNSKHYMQTDSLSSSLEKVIGLDRNHPALNLYLTVYKKYDQLKKTENVIDFSDSIVLPCKALNRHQRLRETLAKQYPFVMVDEAQDLSWPQYYLVSRVCTHGNLVMVGDDDQTIYGFQGSDNTILKAFTKEYGAKVFNFERNYRSSPLIVALGKKLIEHNGNRFDKNMYSMNTTKEYPEPEYLETTKNAMLAKNLVRRIKRDLTEGIKHEDMAILLRSNYLAETVGEMLGDAKVPYTILGANQIDKTFELNAYTLLLRMAISGEDVTAFRELSDIFKVSKKHTEQVVNRARRESRGRHMAVIAAESGSPEMRSFGFELGRIVRTIQKTPAEHSFQRMRSNNLFLQVLLSYRRRSNPAFTDKEQEKVLQDTQAMLDRFFLKPSNMCISNYARYNSLVDAVMSDEGIGLGDKTGVIISTMHKSKGLEWDAVHVVGMSETILPSYNDANEPTELDIESERCLAYVAVTRAKQRLYLYHSAEIKIGEYLRKDLAPSRFVKEMGF